MASKGFKDYKRFPVIMGAHDVLVVHVFERTDNLEDVIWMSDFEPKMYDDIEVYKRAASQFIDQLEGCYCDMFLMELIEVCREKLNKKAV
jgi:hypothetical protein